MRQPDYARAADAAYRVLLRLQVSSLPVRPLTMLRQCRHTRLCTYEQAAELFDVSEDDFARMCGDADAFTVRSVREGQTQYVVCYRVGGNPARLNFTLAHELGHIVLKHDADGIADEAEANHFAMHLLCPAPVVRMAKSPAELAHLCYVSRSAAEAAMNAKQGCSNVELVRQVEVMMRKTLQNPNKNAQAI